MTLSKEQIKARVRENIDRLPHKEYVQKLSLFGSYLHGNPTDESDVDILIEFTPNSPVGFFGMYDIQYFIGNNLQREIDLVTPAALSKYFRNTVLSETETIYEKRAR